MPKLTRIHIHPIKSLDPQSVRQTVVLPSGALEHDRCYAIVDRAGEWVHGKRTPAVHRLRSMLDVGTGLLELRVEGSDSAHVFDMRGNRLDLSTWLSEYFGFPVQVVEDAEHGFPDDTESPGPTLISTSTLEAVASWFGLSLDETRLRFRANLEISGVEPFWEDRLVEDSRRTVRFRVGEAVLEGTNPCARCIVPTRAPSTGEMTAAFSKKFAEYRRQTLPAWARAERFDHYYRLALNTRLAYAKSCTIHVGDEVTILEEP